MDKKIIAGCVAAVIVLGAGGAAYTNYIVGKTKNEIQVEQTEKTDLKNQTLKYLSSEHDSADIETTLKDAFGKLDEADNTTIMDTLLYGTYNAASQYTLSDDDTNELYHVMDDNKAFDLSKLEDDELKQRVENLADNHIALRYVNGNMFYDVDYGYFADTYGQYINPEYKGMLEFYNEEKTVDYYDPANETLYADVVEKRLGELYDMKQAYSTSDILALVDDCYSFYKAVYFGAYSQDYIFTDGKLKQELYDSYKNFADTTKDSDMKAFIEGLLADYDEVSLDRTSPILEKIKGFCGIATADETDTDTEAAESSSETSAATKAETEETEQ